MTKIAVTPAKAGIQLLKSLPPRLRWGVVESITAPLRLMFLFLFLPACASENGAYKDYLARRGLRLPESGSFEHCHGYGCQVKSVIALSAEDWKTIHKIFNLPPSDASDERARISLAVGAFEKIAGAQDGTSGDVAGTFRKTGRYQLDCVDESVNTTVYLSLLEQAGLLRFHAIEGPTMRLPLIDAGHWPHQTAVIREKSSKIRFAVDSWFRDNGAPADIIKLDKWKKGWKPDGVRGFL